MLADLVLPLLDLGGTFVFAISGAVAAVRHRLDTFGLIVLAFAAGNAGGITRDLLIGAVPPAAIAHWAYLGVSARAATFVFLFYPWVQRLAHPVLWMDAVGLAFFAVAGSTKALNHGLGPTAAVLLGVLTGVGGGMLRDVLVRQIPTVIRADFYASAALVGAVVLVGGTYLGLPLELTSILGGLLCFFLRAMAILYSWRLPNVLRLRYRRDCSSRRDPTSRGDR